VARVLLGDGLRPRRVGRDTTQCRQSFDERWLVDGVAAGHARKHSPSDQ
jgi:hypothetical protein